ncbi:hypothetical protein [Sphingomonas sp.]|uniref:hypothetical protein n=1 Tax=Sphingomonas sp. TaxID=28214 RepID=UPI003CC6A6E8
MALTACAAPTAQVAAVGAAPAPAAQATAAPATTAPTPIVTSVASAVAQADRVVLTGERAFAVAELAYTTAAAGVGDLVDAGVIHGATAVRVRGWNAQARTALVIGHTATSAAEKARAAAALFGFADQLDAVREGR